MLHRILPSCAAGLALALAISPSPAATPAQVQASIAKGKQYLYSTQTPDGRWEPAPQRAGVAHDHKNMQGDTYGGFTALAVYALPATGENPQEPRVAKAIEFLKQADVIGVYALGMRAQVWTFLPDTPDTRKLAQRDADLLLKTMISRGPAAGLWGYGDGRTAAGQASPRTDHSASQYGVLGLWACEQAGATIPAAEWAAMDRKWRENQYPDVG